MGATKKQGDWWAPAGVAAATTRSLIPADREETARATQKKTSAADPGRSRRNDVAQLERRWRVGDRLERLLITNHLGSGGMGVVLGALDPDLDRRVAVKVVATRDPVSRARFRREGQAMASLRHPNVVAVFEVGEAGDDSFLVMEYVHGQTLAQQATEMPHSRERYQEVLSLYIEAGRGLAAAHAAGLVHRDFKPANVLVDQAGRVQVTDFGIAARTTHRHEPCTLGEGRAEAPLDLTRESSVLGTPGYMAPEQHRGVADERSDQFSFCVALYQALYGVKPFRGASIDELLYRKEHHLVEPVPGEVEVPPWLLDVLLRGMSADPNDRYDSMDELLSALSYDPSSDLALHSKRRLWLALCAGVSAVGLVAGFWYRISVMGVPPTLESVSWVDAGVLSVLLVAWLRVRRAKRLSRINVLSLCLPTIVVFASVFITILSLRYGIGASAGAQLRMLVWAVGLAVATLTIDSRLWPSVAILATCLILGAIVPEARFFGLGCGLAAIAANVALLSQLHSKGVATRV